MGKSIAGWVVESGKPLLLNGQVDPADFPGTQKKNKGDALHRNASGYVPKRVYYINLIRGLQDEVREVLWG